VAKPNRSPQPLPGPADIDAACQSLTALKDQLTRLVRSGGGEPTAALLSAWADDCPDAVIICTPEAEIRAVNGAAARLTGYSTRDLQRLTVWDLTHGASQAHFDVLWREFLRAGRQRGTYTLRHRDGHLIEAAYCAEAKLIGNLNVGVMRKPDASVLGSVPA
jgi:PAS domain S-box-containing protein